MPRGHQNGVRYKSLVALGTSPNDCWEWTGCANKRTGYGKKQWLGETWLAHRWVWTMLFGTIQKDMTINHMCSNRICVNPHHLEVVSSIDNVRHGAGTKLTLEQASEIKESGKNRKWGDGKKLAEKYGVSGALIHDIWNGRAWKDI